MSISQAFITPYNLYFKGSLLNQTLSKLATTLKLTKTLPPTYAILQYKMSNIVEEYLMPTPVESLTFNELSCSLDLSSYYYESLKGAAFQLNSSPLMGALKLTSIFKQFSDFYLATAQWVYGKRTFRSLAYHSCHFIITTAPLAMTKTSFGQSWEGQLILNIGMLSSLLLSVSYDLYPAKWQLNGQQSSPTVTWLKTKILNSIPRYLKLN